MVEQRADSDEKVACDPAKPFSEPPELDRLIAGVRVLEEWYSGTFRRRIGELTELLSTEIREALRSEFEAEIRARTEIVNTQWENTNRSLKKEIEHLRQQSPNQQLPVNDALAEIAKTEATIDQLDAELERSFTDDSVPLSRLLQLRTTRSDLKSYLRGLRFLDKNSATHAKVGD